MDLNDISAEFQAQISTQSYTSKPTIEGVKIFELKNFRDETGGISEVCRLNSSGGLEIWPQFKPRQINFSTLNPQAIKATHLHYRQDDFWFLPAETEFLIGLKDLRASSVSKGHQLRLFLGAGRACLVLIPRGVAHGIANLTGRKQSMLYLVNNYFYTQAEHCDEHRLDPYLFGTHFWKIKAG